MPPPLFQWADGESGADRWLIEFNLAGRSTLPSFSSKTTQWTPDATAWALVKKSSVAQPVRVIISGFSAEDPDRRVSQGQVTFRTSKDAVGAPLFYREVNLPFLEAVKDPSKIRWRFGPIDSPEPPPIVLERLPVCGNCHSFSSTGKIMGMDVDYANSKASYVIAETGPEMVLRPEDVITWDDYRREDGELTFGLLSQVSPDGKRVISTVKDKSVFVPRPDLAFSQLFFPIKGILVVFDRETGRFSPLPGADDPACVQSNPVWSPDGKHVVFARAQAYNLSNTAARGKALLTPDECREFTAEGKPFRFDLYRVPYNDGQGGTPEPLPGASHNDRSNFFPRYSPDGKWIIFCKANNYMLLQPDSELHIIPAAGGTPRRLRANTSRMNSWHSWSPNSRWLVFSSKANSPYTQLFLTHIDEHGESSPAVLLAHMTAPDRAANIPEFVNVAPGYITTIKERFLDDYSFERAANEFYRAGDPDRAIEKFREALKLNPKNANAHQRLGFLLFNVKQKFDDGLAHTAEALRLDPNHSLAHSDMGMILLHRGQPDRALSHFEAALKRSELRPEVLYQPHSIRYSAAQACLKLGRAEDSLAHLTESISLAPDYADAHYLMALCLALHGDMQRALVHYAKATALHPAIDTSVTLHDLFSISYAKSARWSDAVRSAERALQLARASGKHDLAQAINTRLAQYKGQMPADHAE